MIWNAKARKNSTSHWDKLADEKSKKDFTQRTWGSLASISLNHNYLVTNDRNYYWIDYLKDKYFPNGEAGDVLALGCGEGAIERLFKERGFQYKSLTGVDISEKCMQAAQQRGEAVALAPRITYTVQDLNHYTPAPASFDFIFFFHSLHHVRELERLLAACARALRPGGLLLVNEFVGPARFQWTKKQLALANALFAILPEPLRYDLSAHRVKNEIKPMPVEEMIKIDETEAVRSADIEKVLKGTFTVIDEKNWGGTLNNLIFTDTAGNYDLKNPYHLAIVELLIHHENVLIENGVLPSDFKVYLARPKKTASQKPRTKLRARRKPRAADGR